MRYFKYTDDSQLHKSFKVVYDLCGKRIFVSDPKAVFSLGVYGLMYRFRVHENKLIQVRGISEIFDWSVALSDIEEVFNFIPEFDNL